MKVEQLLSELIRIESVNPPGGEHGIAVYLKGLFDGAGIPNETIESETGRASFIARLGQGKKRLLYLSHADVVPATGSWGFPPFSGQIKDGFVCGRGALDCKGLLAAEVWAMLTLAESTELNGQLIFCAAADEESGGRLGAQFLVEKHPEKLRADFAINEGAEAPVEIKGKRCHFISVGEKGPCWTRIRTRGIAGHGSVPYLPVNAVARMTKVLAALVQYRPRVVLTPEVKELVQALAALNGFTKEVTASNLHDVLARFEDQALALYLTAITRMTVSPNQVHGGVKTNIVPDKCEAEIDIRILPGQDRDYVLKELQPIVGDAETENIQYHTASLSPASTDAYRLIKDTLQESLGDAPILPSICPGATDSRFLREMGVPSYGIGMTTSDLDPGMKASVHGINEKLDIPSLQLKADFLVRLAKKYLG